MLQIPSLSSGLSQRFDTKNSEQPIIIYFKNPHTLKLEGPGGSAVMASTVLRRTSGKPPAVFLNIPAFLRYSGSSLRLTLGEGLGVASSLCLGSGYQITALGVTWDFFFFPSPVLSQMMRALKRMIFHLSS